MTKQTVTRFDTFTRAANEAEGTDEREVVRLFEKRKLLGEFDLDDVTRYDGDFDDADFKAWIDAKPRTLEAAMDYLGEEAPEEGDDEEAEDRGSIVPEKYRILYGATQRCGDDVAETLSAFVTLPRADKKNDIDGGLDRAKLRGVAEMNGIGARLADWEERGLNGGLLRMNTSNVLRGMVRRGERVQIGDRVWEAREVEKPKRTRTKAK